MAPGRYGAGGAGRYGAGMTRPDRMDLSAQRDTLSRRRSDLADALAELASEASLAAKVCRRVRGNPDLDAVYAAARAVERAEEAVDLAALDLATAGGEDA